LLPASAGTDTRPIRKEQSPARTFEGSKVRVYILVSHCLRLAKPAIRGFKEDMHYMIYIYIYMDIMEATMQVSKWGNSLAVRLPKALVDELGLREGDELNVVAARNGNIEVETKEDQRKAALERMAARNWTLPPDYKFDRDEANER
jgi:antitoxin MazE